MNNEVGLRKEYEFNPQPNHSPNVRKVGFVAPRLNELMVKQQLFKR